jgi:hypothetical protein
MPSWMVRTFNISIRMPSRAEAQSWEEPSTYLLQQQWVTDSAGPLVDTSLTCSQLDLVCVSSCLSRLELVHHHYRQGKDYQSN